MRTSPNKSFRPDRSFWQELPEIVVNSGTCPVDTSQLRSTFDPVISTLSR